MTIDYLIENKIDVVPKEKVHAKLLIIDNLLAVVSSYNWTSYPATGDTWDAGIVTFDIEVVDEIINSLNDIT